MTQADLPTLLEKLRAATGGDREIDALEELLRAEYARKLLLPYGPPRLLCSAHLLKR